MRQESPQMNQNIQLRFVKSPIAQANPKSIINLNKIYNKNLKQKENPIGKFREDEYERSGNQYRFKLLKMKIFV